MSFLFPKTANKSQRKLLGQTQGFIGQATSGLSNSDLKAIGAPIQSQISRLSKGGLSPVSLASPGYGINVSGSGNIAMNRTGETQGWMDTLGQGANTDELAYNVLLSQITPGFGRLTNARMEEMRRAGEKAVGNLRDQLARRKVSGASFANDQVGSLQAEYAALTDKLLGESMVEELKMTGDVINQRTAARNQTISTALNQIQFEGDTGAKILMNTQNAMQENSRIQAELAKSLAEIQLQGRLGRGQITAGLSNTYLGQGSQFAGLNAQEAAGPANFLGLLGGAALTGGLSLPSIGGGVTGGLTGVGGSVGPSGYTSPWATPLK